MQLTKESRNTCINIKRTDFGARKITKDKEGHGMMIKESIHQEHVLP